MFERKSVVVLPSLELVVVVSFVTLLQFEQACLLYYATLCD